MARLIGPDSGSQLVYGITGSGALGVAAGLIATVYADAGGTTLANIITYPGGAAITGSLVTVGTDSKLPLFQFPDSVDTVYVSVNGGPITAVYARYDDRIDALTARTIGTTAPLTGGGTLAADRTIGITLAASDIPNLDVAKITTGVFSGNRMPDLEIPNYFSGGWWCVPDIGTSTTNTMTNNQVNLMCLAPARDCTLAGLMVEISTLDSSGTVRFGLATDANGVPGTWLDDYGTVVATATGFVQPPTTPTRALTAGTRYWIGIAGQGLTSGLVLRGRSGWDRRIPLTQSAAPVLFNTSRNAWFANGVSGAFSGALSLSATPGAGVMVGAKLT